MHYIFLLSVFVEAVRFSRMEAVERSPLKEMQLEQVSPKKPKYSQKLLETSVLKFAKLSENATPPSRGSKLAAGFDLYRWVFV